MKLLAPRAASIFQRLVQLNKSKINNTEGFMPVSFEFLYDSPDGKVYSIAHYYTQNGDLMADPEMTFIMIDEKTIIPVSFRQDNLGIYQEALVYDETGKSKGVYTKLQHDLTAFANIWLRNIAEQ